jgi:hypothetical protein
MPYEMQMNVSDQMEGDVNLTLQEQTALAVPTLHEDPEGLQHSHSGNVEIQDGEQYGDTGYGTDGYDADDDEALDELVLEEIVKKWQ